MIPEHVAYGTDLVTDLVSDAELHAFHEYESAVKAYNESVAAVAKGLRDGWITQDEDGTVSFTLYKKGKPKILIEDGFSFWDSAPDHDDIFSLPQHPNFRLSIRRIKKHEVIECQ